MGFQVGMACYGTAEQAAQAYASALGGVVLPVGSDAHIVSIGQVTASAIEYVFTLASTGATSARTVPFLPQPCNMLELADGLNIGWLVAAAWVAAYAVLAIRHALKGETGGSYGNA